MRYLGEGTPRGVRVAGMGLMPLDPPAEPASAGRGEAAYTANCTRCHGADGAGSAGIPPLWGDGSYNAAAGMADDRTAAAFIRANMPDGITFEDPVLSEQEAWDVAAYINGKPARHALPPRTSGPRRRDGRSDRRGDDIGAGARAAGTLGWPARDPGAAPARR